MKMKNEEEVGVSQRMRGVYYFFGTISLSV